MNKPKPQKLYWYNMYLPSQEIWAAKPRQRIEYEKSAIDTTHKYPVRSGRVGKGFSDE